MKRARPSLFGMSLIALGALALTACAGGGGAPSADGPRAEMTIGVDRQPHSLDPYKSVLGGQFLMYLDPIYDTLIHQEPDGTYTPGLATEWEYVSPTEFELTLREGLTFSDGTTPFDADAVKANLDRLHEASGGQTSELAPMYEGTEVIDPSTVLISLSQPNPDLERILSQVLGMMANPTVIEQDPESLEIDPQGIGAYRLDTARTVVGDTYIYTRVDDYWDADAYPADELVVKVYTDRNAMLSALQSGVASVGYGHPDVIEAATGSGLGVSTLPVVLYLLNLTGRDAAPLDDVRVRQALNYAVDRDSILESLYHGYGVATPQIFPDVPGGGFDPQLEEEYAYDPAKATELLAEAGYADGFSFTTALPVAARDTPLAEAIASYFAAVGVTLEITALPPGTMGTEAYQPYDSSVTGFGGQGAFVDAQQVLMPSGLGLNPFDSQSDEFDQLWNTATANVDLDERQAGYQELGARVLEEAWFVPVVRLDAIALYDTSVVNDIQLTTGLSVPRVRGWDLTGA